MKEEKIVEILMELKVDVSAIKTDLREHMHRTSLLETAVGLLKRHQYMVEGALLFIVTAAGLAVKFLK